MTARAGPALEPPASSDERVLSFLVTQVLETSREAAEGLEGRLVPHGRYRSAQPSRAASGGASPSPVMNMRG